jgi:hypothetical protein
MSYDNWSPNCFTPIGCDIMRKPAYFATQTLGTLFAGFAFTERLQPLNTTNQDYILAFDKSNPATTAATGVGTVGTDSTTLSHPHMRSIGWFNRYQTTKSGTNSGSTQQEQSAACLEHRRFAMWSIATVSTPTTKLITLQVNSTPANPCCFMVRLRMRVSSWCVSLQHCVVVYSSVCV